MAKSGNHQKYIKFALYLAVVVLVNIVGMNQFFRMDLTKNKLYALSEASKTAVGNLREPLTIKVFFTKNLPAPHNSTEQYIRDLLSEYHLAAEKYFNYQFYDVSPGEGQGDDKTLENQKLANEYGIHPVQIQTVEKDQVKFMKAYMGMVLINGDLVEQIPTISDTNRLEYQITTAMGKLNNKISALLKLKEKISVTLYLSSSLEAVAPYVQLDEIVGLKDRIADVVAQLNRSHFDKLTFAHIDPSKGAVPNEELAKYQVMSLKWQEMEKGQIPAGQGAIGLVLRHGPKAVSVPLIEAVRIPLIGTQYNMTDLERLGEVVGKNIASLIDINEDIGYLASHGTLNEGLPDYMEQQINTPDRIANFKQLVSRDYTFKDVDLKEGRIDDTFDCLIVANPSEPFSDYELFLIDQYLMRGNHLAVFLDAFKVVENPAQQPMMGNAQPIFLPQKTGLEKILAHYGVTYQTSYVLDKNCFKQRVHPRFGGGEQPLYFAPIIDNKNISHDLDFMKSIKGLVTMRISPLELNREIIKENKITAHALFSSSDQAWEMEDRIQLNPAMIHPPIAEEHYGVFSLAYLLEGQFPSYFKGKPIPEKSQASAETPEETPDEPPDQPDPPVQNAPSIEQEGTFIEQGKPGKILFIASAELLKDTMVDEEGQGPNALFLLNAMDALNGRTDTAVLRGKEQRFNPLEETDPAVKTFIKVFNIVGLPVLMVAFGMGVWFRRAQRKKRIQMMFGK